MVLPSSDYQTDCEGPQESTAQALLREGRGRACRPPWSPRKCPGRGRGVPTQERMGRQPATFALCRQARNRRTASLQCLNPCHSEPLLQQGSARLCAPEVPANAHKQSSMHSSSALLPAGEAGTACATASAAAGRAVPRRPQRSQEELGALLDGVRGAGDGVPDGLWGREDLMVVATLHGNIIIQDYDK